MELSTTRRKICRKFENFKKKLLIIGMACLVTVLFVAWKTFHKNLLSAYHISAFLFIVIFIYIYIYMYDIQVISGKTLCSPGFINNSRDIFK